MRRGKGRNGLLPSSLRIISSCLKTVSANAGNVANSVRSAGASVASSISVPPEDEKDQVLWVGFDKLELGPASFKHVLLLGYTNGFQVLDVEDASNVCELVSRRDGPVTFLQIQPMPAKSEWDGFRTSHPMLLTVAGDETKGSGMVQGGRLSALIRDGLSEPQQGNCLSAPTVVRFYSLKSHTYVHFLRFRSAVYLVRCSPRIVAVALAAQIYCFDAVTLENKFSVLTYPLQGAAGVNIGYGPMAVGPRWLAYASNNPLLSNVGRLSPQNLTPSPGVSPSTSPGSGSLVARYAMESSKQLASGILSIGDMGYKTLSKYYQELVPDGSCSPLAPNSNRRTGRLPPATHSCEADNAGMVMIKDFISKEVISQFRAHTSPISALCFDPSGTLLVTASVNGHNLNVFRIMPTCMKNASNSTCYDWSSSHVHLYKLYRGLTPAVIQDICFSHYSQWIAIVSSRGTCHIFLMSPFGGDASLQLQSPYFDGPNPIPNLTMPWWSSLSCMIEQHFLQPPPPLTVSVVSRIKNFSSGWLNTVSSVTASAAGKMPIPSGAIAAVFHNSISHPIPPVNANNCSLEHLLVYSPSGHLIQHELLPSLGEESSDSSSRSESGPLLQFQDEELHVNIESVQWWDVCRRSNWPEREQNIPQVIFYGQNNVETVENTSDSTIGNNSCSAPSTDFLTGKKSLKTHERPHWYLSNAEVQVCSGRMPIWQKKKICFYVMMLSKANENTACGCDGGEIEIEKLAFHEVEIKRKDLLPVFKRSHLVCEDGCVGGERDQNSTTYNFEGANELVKGTSTVGYTMTPPVGPVSDAAAGSASSCTADNMYNFSGVCTEEPAPSNSQFVSKLLCQNSNFNNFDETIVSSEKNNPAGNRVIYPNTGFCSSYANCSPVDIPTVKGIAVVNSTNSLSSGLSNGSTPDSNMEHMEVSASHNSIKFPRNFHEGYCNVSDLDDCRELTDAVTDVDSSISSHCERGKSEDGDNNDEMLGGVFVYSEG
ncbi:autophagy-related protein 18h-like isoform X2 [Phalaenopsis equestris]|uniref:autophagy-related protein 18h-like isoform X2 n=1 Tax=Phalaenopsis equestris TaxID=78828 RepID=UPI0009E52AB3|nr:autophagy-related protein 18h-like isoform X2 [Phalaenopsis equestris]